MVRQLKKNEKEAKGLYFWTALRIILTYSLYWKS